MQKCFIVGCQRSGTTWVQRLLQSHPLVCGGEESQFFKLFAPALSKSREMASRQRKIGPLIYASENELVDAIRQLWDAVFDSYLTEHSKALVHVEKSPGHSLYLPEITEVFPDAKIVIIHRDSRAVVSSIVAASKGWGAHWAPKNYSDAAIRWFIYVNAIEKWRKENPHIACMEIRYEKCLLDPIETMRETFQFLGLPPTENSEMKQFLDNVDHSRSEDPSGFSRLRGNEGWRSDLPWYGKLVTWRYTRRLMNELGYDCRPLG